MMRKYFFTRCILHASLAEIYTMHSNALYRSLVEISTMHSFALDKKVLVQRSALCRSRRELSNAYLLAKFGFDTAENEPFRDGREMLRGVPLERLLELALSQGLFVPALIILAPRAGGGSGGYPILGYKYFFLHFFLN